MAYKVSVYYFTEAGERLADKICGGKRYIFRCQNLVFCKEENNIIDKEKFNNSSAHVFIGATGIAVRKIAPFLETKMSDPAVLAIDEKGKYVIPILSGHIGGANSLAEIIASKLNATPVITTATDVNGLNSIDKIAAEHRLVISDKEEIRVANSKMLLNETVNVYLDKDIEVIPDKTGVYKITESDEADVKIYSGANIVIGVGCRKNTDAKIFSEFIDDAISDLGIAHTDIDRIVSIDLKANENAIVSYSLKNNIMFETYTADELNSVSGDFDESDFVREITGVSNVSERAAVYGGSLLGSGEFLLKRKSENGITISVYKVKKRINLNGKA